MAAYVAAARIVVEAVVVGWRQRVGGGGRDAQLGIAVGIYRR